MPSGYKDEASRGQRMGIELGNGDGKAAGVGPPSPARCGRLASKLLLFCGLDPLPRAKVVHALGLPLKSSF